jgi:hypothetical protein
MLVQPYGGNNGGLFGNGNNDWWILLLFLFGFFSNILPTIANRTQLWYAHTLAGVSMISLVIGIMAACIMALVIMISRFHSNLLGEQGYLMLTLPVSIHKLILSKLLISVFWFGATFVACFLAVYIQSFSSYTIDATREFFETLFFLLREINGEAQLLEQRQAFILIFEIILLIGLCMAAFSLFVYAAMAIGHSFSRHKVLLSFVAFFGINFVLQSMGTGLFAFIVDSDTALGDFFCVATFFQGMQMVIGIGAFCAIALGAVFFFITVCMMKRRLNLQ